MISASQLRLWLGVAGVIAAALAVATDSRTAGWVAAVLLAAAVLSRVVAARRSRSPDDRAGG